MSSILSELNVNLISDYKKENYPFSDNKCAVTRNNPYTAQLLPVDVPRAADLFFEPFADEYEDESAEKVHKVVVQFKCHKAEFNSAFSVQLGEYVVVQGDRGLDIGVVVAFESVSNVTPSINSVINRASQKDVDCWATDLKKAEFEALQIARQQVLALKLDMSILQAEYQYDKKKLTLYYIAPDRVEYDGLTKELFRNFGCRIWLVKVETGN